jgi:nucleoside-diphosphate-sugar epimerase
LENQVTKYPILLKYKKPKLVAITGGTGFVGNELIKKCIAHGWHLRLLTRGNKSIPTSSQIEIFHGDLTNTSDWSEFIKNVDVIINCAGVIEDKKNINAVNVEGSLRLLNASIGKVKRWVQLSSAGVYGVPEGKIINEKSSLLPKTPYEISKANFDNILNEVAIKNKLDFVILRPTIIFGSRMTNQSMFQLVRAIKRNIFFFIGSPGYFANYIHVNDVVNALMLSAVKPKNTKNIYNISNKITIEKLIVIICQALYIPTPKLRLPLFIVKPLVIILGWLPFVSLTSSRLKALTSKTKYSTELIEKNLGFKFEVPLRDGLNSFVKHFL